MIAKIVVISDTSKQMAVYFRVIRKIFTAYRVNQQVQNYE